MSYRQSSTNSHVDTHYIFSKHARDRMAQRQVKKSEVFMALNRGKQPRKWYGGTIPFTWAISPDMRMEIVVIVNPWTRVIVTVYWQPRRNTNNGAYTKQNIKEESHV